MNEFTENKINLARAYECYDAFKKKEWPGAVENEKIKGVLIFNFQKVDHVDGYDNAAKVTVYMNPDSKKDPNCIEVGSQINELDDWTDATYLVSSTGEDVNLERFNKYILEDELGDFFKMFPHLMMEIVSAGWFEGSSRPSDCYSDRFNYRASNDSIKSLEGSIDDDYTVFLNIMSDSHGKPTLLNEYNRVTGMAFRGEAKENCMYSLDHLFMFNYMVNECVKQGYKKSALMNISGVRMYPRFMKELATSKAIYIGGSDCISRTVESDNNRNIESTNTLNRVMNFALSHANGHVCFIDSTMEESRDIFLKYTGVKRKYKIQPTVIEGTPFLEDFGNIFTRLDGFKKLVNGEITYTIAEACTLSNQIQTVVINNYSSMVNPYGDTLGNRTDDLNDIIEFCINNKIRVIVIATQNYMANPRNIRSIGKFKKYYIDEHDCEVNYSGDTDNQ